MAPAASLGGGDGPGAAPLGAASGTLPPVVIRRNEERGSSDQATRNLFVANIAEGCDENTLRDYFRQFGPVTNIKYMRPQPGRSARAGFVDFANVEDAVKAFSQQHTVHGNRLRLDFNNRTSAPPSAATPPPKPPEKDTSSFYVPPRAREMASGAWPPTNGGGADSAPAAHCRTGARRRRSRRRRWLRWRGGAVSSWADRSSMWGGAIAPAAAAARRGCRRRSGIGRRWAAAAAAAVGRRRWGGRHLPSRPARSRPRRRATVGRAAALAAASPLAAPRPARV